MGYLIFKALAPGQRTTAAAEGGYFDEPTSEAAAEAAAAEAEAQNAESTGPVPLDFHFGKELVRRFKNAFSDPCAHMNEFYRTWFWSNRNVCAWLETKSDRARFAQIVEGSWNQPTIWSQFHNFLEWNDDYFGILEQLVTETE